jgi:hypothetical protein
VNQFADAAITEGVKPVLLCTLWASDIVVRLANTPTDVPDVLNATTYFYDAGLLEIEDFAEELDFYEMTSAGTIQQSNVKLVLPRSVSAIALDAQGLYLVGMEAEISMIWPGDDYANRRVLVARSIVGRPRFGIENANWAQNQCTMYGDQILDAAIELGNGNGKVMTVDEMLTFALGGNIQKPEAYPLVNTLSKWLTKIPLKFPHWEPSKVSRVKELIQQLMEELK